MGDMAKSFARSWLRRTANDHRCVYVEIAHQVDVAGSGPPRELGPRLGGIAHTDARWAIYRAAVGRAMHSARMINR